MGKSLGRERNFEEVCLEPEGRYQVDISRRIGGGGKELDKRNICPHVARVQQEIYESANNSADNLKIRTCILLYLL